MAKKETPKPEKSKKSTPVEKPAPPAAAASGKAHLGINKRDKLKLPETAKQGKYAVEARWVLLSPDGDQTPDSSGVSLYDRVLNNGVAIEQGYLLEKPMAIIKDLGITLNFVPSTFRLRKEGGKNLTLTLKNRVKSKENPAAAYVQEITVEVPTDIFKKYWPQTKGMRISKKRLTISIKKHKLTVDAFVDRLLLMAEYEVADITTLYDLPEFGKAVTGEPAWSNKSLAKPQQ